MAASISMSPFEDGALQSADKFRALMDAMARPGEVMAATGDVAKIGNLNSGAALIAETLCDHEVSVWLDSTLIQASTREDFSFVCGCGFSDKISEADFVFFNGLPEKHTFDQLKVGNAQYPDQSVTLVLAVTSLADGQKLELEGPGIKSIQTIKVNGLDEHFVDWWERNNSLFPLGVDVFLTTDSDLMALPRTVKIREMIPCM